MAIVPFLLQKKLYKKENFGGNIGISKNDSTLLKVKMHLFIII